MEHISVSEETLLRRATDFELRKGTKLLSANGLFEEAYQDLDPLFDFNAKQRTVSEDSVAREKRESFIDRWKDRIQSKELALVMHWENGNGGSTEREIAPVTVRTNFDRFRERRPSIINVTDHHGNIFYVRLLEDHTIDTSIFNDFQDLGVKTTNDPKTLELLLGKRVIEPRWNQWLQKGQVRPLGDQRFKVPYIYIPETHLFHVLESLYKDGVPRITPRVRVIEKTNNYLCVVRPALNPVIDAGVDEKMMSLMGQYFGVLHALGLSDIYDRQLDHYAILPSIDEQEEPSIVNFDPDFMILDRRVVRSRRGPLSIDANEFKKQFKERYQAVSRREWKAFYQARRETWEAMTKHIGRKEIETEFYRRLKPSLSEYPLELGNQRMRT